MRLYGGRGAVSDAAKRILGRGRGSRVSPDAKVAADRPAAAPATAGVPPVEDPAVDLGFAGIPNVGNTCFINAWLQAMRPTGAYQGACARADTGSPSGAGPTSSALAEALCSVLEWPTESGARRLALALSAEDSEFVLRAQQDAHDFGTLATSVLHGASAWAHDRAATSPVADKLRGALEHRTCCGGCGRCGTILEPMWDLAVPVRDAREVELSDCVSEGMAPQRVHSVCPGCGIASLRDQTTRIAEHPKFLVVHLLRFDSLGRKLYTKVRCRSRRLSIDGRDYVPVACVVHIGTESKGHYVARGVDLGSGIAWRADDAVVESMRAEDLFMGEGDVYVVVLKRA